MQHPLWPLEAFQLQGQWQPLAVAVAVARHFGWY
jgi:hypothetical protein